jgi:3-oxoacyl-(acyl-carrier-protein) synthase
VFDVGGRRFSLKHIMLKTASTAPAAPRRWPIDDFVDDIDKPSTSPAEDGDGAYRSILMALNESGINPEEIDYVNAHGTSTPLGDEIELKAVEKAFKGKVDGLSMSSTKSSIGHLLGAAGAV